MRSFGEPLCTGKINIDEAETDQINLLENLVQFSERSRPKTVDDKDKKKKHFWKCKYSL